MNPLITFHWYNNSSKPSDFNKRFSGCTQRVRIISKVNYKMGIGPPFYVGPETCNLIVKIGSIFEVRNFKSDCKMIPICTNVKFQSLSCSQFVVHLRNYSNSLCIHWMAVLVLRVFVIVSAFPHTIQYDKKIISLF